MWKIIVITSLVFVLSGCTEIEPKPFEPSSGHIDTQEQPVGEIPELVAQVPILPEPVPAVDLEKYTVVVNEVPVKELLFALARDAQINVDIDPVIDGVVTINAVEQTLPQILERITRQVDLRYEFEGDNLIIMKDEPYLRTYVIDYVNMSRDTSSSNTVATQIAATSGGEGGGESSTAGNNSVTDVSSFSSHHFWGTLVLNISAILGGCPHCVGYGAAASTNSGVLRHNTGQYKTAGPDSGDDC
jgi:general secretion pathway protein D